MPVLTPPKLYGIIGNCLGNSMTPLLYDVAFKAMWHSAVMVPWDIRQDQLPAFIDSVRLLDIQGVAVTLPYKTAVIPLLDEVSIRVQSIGSCNTIYRKEGKVCGENTDIIGFMRPLEKNPLPKDTPVLLMGAGGVAMSVVAGLQFLGYTDITVTDASTDNEQRLANIFSLKRLPWAERSRAAAGLYVNATPLGMKGKFENESPYEQSWFSNKQGVVYDVVYTPGETPLQRQAKNAGLTAISGREMFLAQANAQCRIWTNRPLPKKARQAIIDAL